MSTIERDELDKFEQQFAAVQAEAAAMRRLTDDAYRLTTDYPRPNDDNAMIYRIRSLSRAGRLFKAPQAATCSKRCGGRMSGSRRLSERGTRSATITKPA